VSAWADIDLKGGVIAVAGTKTEASRAEVPLLAPLAAILKEHRARMAKRGLQLVAPDALLFVTGTGRSPGRRNALRALQVAAVKAGVATDDTQPLGLHDLRHSLAANSFALGLNEVEVALLLRHSSPRTTMAVYAGMTDDGVAALAGKLAALGGAR
jgi:integrase